MKEQSANAVNMSSKTVESPRAFRSSSRPIFVKSQTVTRSKLGTWYRSIVNSPRYLDTPATLLEIYGTTTESVRTVLSRIGLARRGFGSRIRFVPE